jgi:hypothetical protein
MGQELLSDDGKMIQATKATTIIRQWWPSADWDHHAAT